MGKVFSEKVKTRRNSSVLGKEKREEASMPDLSTTERQLLLEQIQAQQEMIQMTTEYMLQIQQKLELSEKLLDVENKNLENELKEKNLKLQKSLDEVSKEVVKREKVQQDLVKANNELNILLYRSSHDFKGPVCTAMGLINLIRGNTSDFNVLPYLSLLENSLSKLDKLIDNISSIANFKQNEVLPEQIGFKEVIESVWQNLRNLENHKHVDIRIVLNTTQAFSSDLFLLKSIFYHIFENTIRYTNYPVQPPFVEVKVSDCEEGNGIRIDIQDNGVGIKEEFLPNVFDMFFRANEYSKGSGLGLYIVRLAMEKLNGTVSIISEEHKGTTVRLVLPGFSGNKERAIFINK